MLRQSGYFRIDGSLSAQGAGFAHRTGIALQSTEDQGIDHAVDIANCFGIREGLICHNLLQAI